MEADGMYSFHVFPTDRQSCVDPSCQGAGRKELPNEEANGATVTTVVGE